LPGRSRQVRGSAAAIIESYDVYLNRVWRVQIIVFPDMSGVRQQRMRVKWLKWVGLLLLCVYAAAVVHQMLPHDDCHGHGEACALCLLLANAALPAVCAVLVLRRRIVSPALLAPTPPSSRTPRSPFSLRGPPCF